MPPNIFSTLICGTRTMNLQTFIWSISTGMKTGHKNLFTELRNISKRTMSHLQLSQNMESAKNIVK